MKHAIFDPQIFNTDYLSEMNNGSELEEICLIAMARAEDLETMLQLRVELIVTILRLSQSGTSSELYFFLRSLIGELQLKIAALKLVASASSPSR